MRHYEIVLMIHPDQSEQVNGMVERYVSIVKTNTGTVHRQEDWGRRQLAYPINKLHKAHYLLFNIECDQTTLDELSNAFRFNDAIIRDLVLSRKNAITEQSAMAKLKDKREDSDNFNAKSDRDDRDRDDRDRGDRDRGRKPDEVEKPTTPVADEIKIEEE